MAAPLRACRSGAPRRSHRSSPRLGGSARINSSTGFGAARVPTADRLSSCHAPSMPAGYDTELARCTVGAREVRRVHGKTADTLGPPRWSTHEPLALPCGCGFVARGVVRVALAASAVVPARMTSVDPVDQQRVDHPGPRCGGSRSSVAHCLRAESHRRCSV